MGEATEGQKAPICQKCKSAPMIRVGREGVMENLVYAKVGFYPWECPVCRTRVLVKNRGKKSRHHRKSSVVTEPVEP